MTIRAWLLGLLGVVGICSYTYVNDALLKQTYLVGNSMPLAVYGSLVLLILLVNPLLGKIHKRLPLNGRELALVLVLTLSACVIPSSGLLRTFAGSLVIPQRFNKVQPGWQENNVLDLVPDRMIVRPEGDEGYDTVVNGFTQGLSTADQSISFAEVPWEAWLPTLAFWVPLLLVLWVGLIGLSVILHRQWSQHEQLPYPIAQFANFLLPKESDSTSSIVVNRLFWMGLLAILLFHTNNYLFTWFPRIFIEVPRDFDLNPLSELIPTMLSGGGGFALRPTLYFTVIAFAYFLSSDVSFSMGIGPYLFSFVAGYFLLNYGISLSGGGYLAQKPQTFLNFGSYLGLFLVLLYTGRQYYSQTFRQALWLPGSDTVASSSRWGARIFILSGLAFVTMLGAVGFDWQLALLYWAFMVMIFAVMGRILAETGLFLIQPAAFPCVMLLGIFGAQALGPGAVAVMFMMTAVFLIDPREALMPFLVNNFKIVDMRKLKVGRSMWGFAVALVIGLAVAVPFTLYLQYDRGANLSDRWAFEFVPRMPFEEALKIEQRLDAQEQLETANAMSGFDRFTHLAPDGGAMFALFAGLALVLGFSFCRLRFAWWPLHPVLFLIWATNPGKWFAFSFSLGWLIKLLVSKYGGARIYQQLKPLMIGIIAGDMLGGVLPSLIGIIYFLFTGEIPESYRVMPG